MKALAYQQAHSLQSFAIQQVEVPLPELRENDVRVRVKAVSVNPVDYKIRQNRSAQGERPVILGWDAAGVIDQVGPAVRGFQVGDEVFYAGDLQREGSNAELQAVDHRIIAKKPRSLGFAEAAAIPLTALTAWEALLERQPVPFTDKTRVLVIGGAGGVGSVALQLLKAKTPVQVITTASRPETVEWCRRMGADLVIDHSRGLREELERNNIREVDAVFGTTHSDRYVEVLPQIIRPFGHFVLIDDPPSLNISGFKRKSITVAWELMFTKSLYSYELQTQGDILREVASLVDAGKVKTTANLTLKGFSAQNLKRAHELLESSKAIGKIVIDFEAREER